MIRREHSNDTEERYKEDVRLPCDTRVKYTKGTEVMTAEVLHSNGTVVDLPVCRVRFSLLNSHWKANVLTYFLNFFKHVCMIYQFSICLVGLKKSEMAEHLWTLCSKGVPLRYLSHISSWAGEPASRAPNRSDHGLCCTIFLSTWVNDKDALSIDTVLNWLTHGLSFLAEISHSIDIQTIPHTHVVSSDRTEVLRNMSIFKLLQLKRFVRLRKIYLRTFVMYKKLNVN